MYVQSILDSIFWVKNRSYISKRLFTYRNRLLESLICGVHFYVFIPIYTQCRGRIVKYLYPNWLWPSYHCSTPELSAKGCPLVGYLTLLSQINHYYKSNIIIILTVFLVLIKIILIKSHFTYFNYYCSKSGSFWYQSFQ